MQVIHRDLNSSERIMYIIFYVLDVPDHVPQDAPSSQIWIDHILLIPLAIHEGRLHLVRVMTGYMRLSISWNSSSCTLR